MAGRDWARLLALAAVWSGSFLCTEIALRDFGPLTIAAGRVALGPRFVDEGPRHAFPRRALAGSRC